MIVQLNQILQMSGFLRSMGFSIRRHYNEFFIYDDKGFFCYLLYRRSDLIEIYLPKWRKADKEKLFLLKRKIKRIFSNPKIKIFK
ncbi:MAG: hypothetical protein ACTSSP_01665 [Candidatus Asgardarchaeia archaeon]